MNLDKYIDRVREFNRFYTVSLGMVGKNYKESYSIAESRILYELRAKPGLTAGYLVDLLHLDKGYISRLIKKFINAGILTKITSEEDARVLYLYLTEEGERLADRLINETNDQIYSLLANFNETECEEICAAMDVITKYFQHDNKEV